jgi:hypothetical protein
MLNATYLLAVVPLLGSGLVITVHSWIVAYRERRLASMSLATWNTFAMAHNSYGAVSGAGDALSSVFKGLSSSNDDARKKLAVVALILVALAAASGIILTATLIHHYAGTMERPERAGDVSR